MKKKSLSVLLALTMILSLFATGFAVGEPELDVEEPVKQVKSLKPVAVEAFEAEEEPDPVVCEDCEKDLDACECPAEEEFGTNQLIVCDICDDGCDGADCGCNECHVQSEPCDACESDVCVCNITSDDFGNGIYGDAASYQVDLGYVGFFGNLEDKTYNVAYNIYNREKNKCYGNPIDTVTTSVKYEGKNTSSDRVVFSLSGYEPGDYCIHPVCPHQISGVLTISSWKDGCKDNNPCNQLTLNENGTTTIKGSAYEYGIGTCGITSDPETTDFSINKIDSETKNPISEVSFKLVGTGYEQTKATDGNGNVTFTGLAAGTYTLTETVPEGYQQAGPWTVVVTENDGVFTITVGGESYGNPHTIVNTKEVVETGPKVTLKKLISVGGTTLTAEELAFSDYGEYTFDIWKKGRVLYTSHVATVKVPAGETVDITDLVSAPGDYKVEERLLINKDFRGVTYENQTFTINEDTKTIEVKATNDYKGKPGKLTISKVFGTEDGKPPAGLDSIKFVVLYPNLKTTTVTLPTADGEWSVTLDNLDNGFYTVTEQNAKVEGYSWTVNKLVDTVRVSDQNPEREVTFTNTYKLKTTDFKIHKYAWVKREDTWHTVYDRTSLAGAKFTLKGVSGTNPSYSAEIETTSNGKITFKGLSVGEYEMEEVTAPAGYVKPEKPWKVVVKENLFGDLIIYVEGKLHPVVDRYEIRNFKEGESPEFLSNVEVTKNWDFPEDAEMPKELEDDDMQITVNLYKLPRGEGADPDYTAAMTKSNNWSVTFGGLEAGEYQIEEVTDGIELLGDYALESTTYSGDVEITDGIFAIPENESDEVQTIKLSVTNTYKEKEEPKLTTLNVEKLWGFPGDLNTPDDFEGIEDLEIAITLIGDNYSETEVLTKDNGWKCSFEDLEPGEYRIEESTTNIGELGGFVLKSDFPYYMIDRVRLEDGEFEIEAADEDQEIELTIINEYGNLDDKTLTVRKTWSGLGSRLWKEVKVTLYKIDDTPGTEPPIVGGNTDEVKHTFTLNADNGWSSTESFSDLGLELGKYRLVEDTSGMGVAGYRYNGVSYTNGGVFEITEESVAGIVITVTNSYRTRVTPDPDPSPTPTTTPDLEEDIPDPDTPLAPPTVDNPPVDIIDPETPLADEPPVDIVDPETPLAPKPDETIDIEDGETPLADAPRTVDNTNLGALWIMLAVSALAVGCFAISRRKREKS